MKSRIVAPFILIVVLCFKSLAQGDNLVLTFNKSILLEKNQDYIGALKAMKELKDSTCYEAILRMGWLNYKAGFKKKSLSFYNRAIALKPKAIEPRLGLSYPAYILEEFSELKNQYVKILEIDANNKSANYNLGLVYYYNKEYSKALPYFQKLETFYPFDYDKNIYLAWTYLRLEKNTESETVFNTVLLYSPDDASALEGMAALGKANAIDEKFEKAFFKSYDLSSKSDYNGAINALKEVYDKSSYAINLRLGWLYYLQAQHLESLNYYKIACSLKPSSIEVKQGCVLPLASLGNKTEELSTHQSILQLDPNNSVSLYAVGKIYYEQKDYDNAYKHFDKVLSLYPFDYSGLLMMGWTHYQFGRTADSFNCFNKVLAQAPNDKSAILGLNTRPLEEIKNQPKSIKAK